MTDEGKQAALQALQAATRNGISAAALPDRIAEGLRERDAKRRGTNNNSQTNRADWLTSSYNSVETNED